MTAAPHIIEAVSCDPCECEVFDACGLTPDEARDLYGPDAEEAFGGWIYDV